MTLLRLLGVIALAASLMTPVSAQAQSSPPASQASYVYWGYWQSDANGWVSATEGAGSVTPADGSVQGWRYGSGTAANTSSEPAAKPDFTAICQTTSPAAGSKRVAVVIDFGSAQDAPAGTTPPSPISACAQVPEAANGIQVAQSVASVGTTPAGMVCAINNYPPDGCATTTTTSDQSGAPSTRWLSAVGALAIILILVTAIVIARRRGSNG